MKRPARRPRSSAPLAPADESRIEALTVAMALAPGVYARNRMFALFKNPAVQRAKSRAAMLRGIVKHLGRACAVTLVLEGTDFTLRYQIPAIRLMRVAELTRVELAALRVMASKASAPCLLPEEGDKALVETALARLLGESGDEARASHDATPPGE